MFGSLGLYLNFSVFQAHPSHFNNSALRGEGEEREESEEEEEGVVTFVAMQLFHRFTPPIGCWSTHSGRSSPSSQKGGKNVKGNSSLCRLSLPFSLLSLPNVHCSSARSLRFTVASCALKKKRTSRQKRDSYRTGAHAEVVRVCRGEVVWGGFTHCAGCRRATPSPAPTLWELCRTSAATRATTGPAVDTPGCLRP